MSRPIDEILLRKLEAEERFMLDRLRYSLQLRLDEELNIRECLRRVQDRIAAIKQEDANG